MKKIGIVSYNIYANFTNYGSALQSWALSQTINRLGNGKWEAKLIDYCPDILADKDPLNPMKNMWDTDEKMRKECELSLPAIKINYDKFMTFYNEKFSKTKKVYTSTNFNDVVNDEKITGFVCGSDTIFCVDEFGIDDGYYANYDCMKNGQTISYAASFGDAHFDDETYKILNARLQNFKALGLRENKLIDYVKEHTKVEVQKVLDPTLLLDADDYDSITAEEKYNDKYLLLYSRRYNQNMYDYAEKIAKANNWKIVEISLQASNKDKHIMSYESGVEEFLSLVKHSEFVVTNSFHGMIFSVQFEKQFVIFSREQCGNKITELLDLFGLNDRILITGQEKFKRINYKKVKENIKKEREKSLDFLYRNLEKMQDGFLNTNRKDECYGCEACAQVCPKNAIKIVKDKEEFRYPQIDKDLCINCGLCRQICPFANKPPKHSDNKYAFGGYHKDSKICDKSTSGGAFSAIVDSFCDDNYVIFGAKSDGLNVYHTYIEDKKDIDVFRKSKYSQSVIGNSYKQAKSFLQKGKKVLFSGTPCQLAGLSSFLKNENTDNLLMVEVVCEGVPSPLFIKKYVNNIEQKYHSRVVSVDYRFKDGKPIKEPRKGKWDFQVMCFRLENGKIIKKDRWFNPFWKIWLSHLMSRPSCYNCQFTEAARVADITLGDLWGVHLYCPELYGRNMGASLVICNTPKGKKVLDNAKQYLYGHELNFENALKYQSPLRKRIDENPSRSCFMNDLMDTNISYKDLCRKWYKKPSLKLLFSKYIWGNRQKIFMWNLRNGVKNGKRND